jgi:hypothetical protein
VRQPSWVLRLSLRRPSVLIFALRPKDMQRMPPTTEPLIQNSLYETFFWILADETERQVAADAHRHSDSDGRTMCYIRAPVA